MTSRRLYHVLAAMLAFLFLAFQTAGTLHETSAIEDTDHAECVSCLVISQDSDVETVVPIVPVHTDLVVSPYIEAYTFQLTSVWTLQPPGRAPPLRGPPNAHI